MPLLTNVALYYPALAAADKPTPGASRPLAYMVRRPTQPPTVLAILPRSVGRFVERAFSGRADRLVRDAYIHRKVLKRTFKLHCHRSGVERTAARRAFSMTYRAQLDRIRFDHVDGFARVCTSGRSPKSARLFRIRTNVYYFFFFLGRRADFSAS